MRQLLTSQTMICAKTVVCATLVLASAPSLSRAADPPSGYRELAPGVEITIPPDAQEGETVSKKDIVEIVHGIPGLDWSPKFTSESQTLKQMATGTEFRRDIWALEFTFKPVRMIWVDVPQASGKMQRQLIWYMVYRVRNTGGALRPTQKDDGSVVIEPFDREIRFFPQFVLESHEFKKAYLDRIIPTAVAAIQQKEDPNRKLLNTVEIGNKLIQISTDFVDKSVWGVATWENVDPRIDYFSVYVEGLTNAYQWVDPPEAFKPGHPPTSGRVLLQKNLMLNFWRPGDERLEDQRTIHFGIPGKVDHSWVYR
jgi:hypothetical protein